LNKFPEIWEISALTTLNLTISSGKRILNVDDQLAENISVSTVQSPRVTHETGAVP